MLNTKKNKIISFGEILIRLSPDWQDNKAQIFVGGSEANMAAALGCWGSNINYISCMPENALAQQIIYQLKDAGIDIDQMIWGGERIGIYFLAQGNDLKHDAVVYDRNFSSFSNLKPGMIGWDTILENASWFHWSAITPSLNEDLALVCKEALTAAAKKNMLISTDMNYRSKLWQYGKQPVEIIPDLVQHCNVVMGNIWSSHKMLATSLDENILHVNTKENYLHAAQKTSEEIMQQFPKCKHVALTFRFSKAATHNLYYATYFHEGKMECSKQYETNEVIDRIGSGDSFMAGLIYSINEGMSSKEIVEFATAAAFKKFFVKGDFNTVSKEEILQLINS